MFPEACLEFFEVDDALMESWILKFIGRALQNGDANARVP
jgi:hypothetical protein